MFPERFPHNDEKGDLTQVVRSHVLTDGAGALVRQSNILPALLVVVVLTLESDAAFRRNFLHTDVAEARGHLVHLGGHFHRARLVSDGLHVRMRNRTVTLFWSIFFAHEYCHTVECIIGRKY